MGSLKKRASGPERALPVFLLLTLLLAGCDNGDTTFKPTIALRIGTQAINRDDNHVMTNVVEGEVGGEETITIRNEGLAPLLLTGTKPVDITGADAADFEVTVQPETTIAAGSSKDFKIRFKPGTAGAKSALVTIANNAEAFTFLLSAEALSKAAAPAIAVSSGTTEIVNNGQYDFGNVTFGTSKDAVFTVRNTGNAALVLNGSPLVAISGSDTANFSAASQPSSATVEAGATTSFTLRFTPGSTGSFSATVAIVNNSTVSPYTIALLGSALSPDIALRQGTAELPMAGTLDFGVVPADQYKDIELTVVNTGTADLNLTAPTRVALSGLNKSFFSVLAQPGAVIGVGASAKFTLRFNPAGSEGTFSAAVSIANDSPSKNPYTLALAATTSGPGILVARGAAEVPNNETLDFGQLADEAYRDVVLTITNNGTSELQLTGNSFTGTNRTQFTVAAAPASAVSAGNSTSMTVRFTPNGTIGSFSAALSIGNNTAGSDPFLINLAAETLGSGMAVTVTSGGVSVANNGAVDFGSLTDEAYRDVGLTITNSGAATLQIYSNAVTGTNANRFVVTGAPASTVAAGSSTAMTVRFTHPGTIGSFSALLTLGSNAPGATSFLVYLEAETLGAGIAVSVTAGGASVAHNGTLDFGSIADETYKDIGLTITDNGAATLQLTGNTFSGSDSGRFSVAAGPAASVASGASTTLTVRFTPDGTIRSFSAVLSIGNNTPGTNPFVVYLAATTLSSGIAVANGASGVAHNGTLNFGSITDEAYRDVILTVSNPGAATLSLSAADSNITGTNRTQFTVADPPDASVAPGSSTAVTLRFTPNGVIGTFTAMLSIPNNTATTNPYVIYLTAQTLGSGISVADGGTGIAQNGTLDFGSITDESYKDVTLTITNSGSATLTLAAADANITGANRLQFTVTDPPDASVAAASQTSMTVRFTPNGVIGTFSATLSIVNNTPAANPFVIYLAAQTLGSDIELRLGDTNGTVYAPSAVIAHGNLDHDGSGLSLAADVGFTIVNTGSATLTLGNTTYPGGVYFPVGGDHALLSLKTPPATSVSPGSSTGFTITLGIGTVADHSASFAIASNAAGKTTVQFGITWTRSEPVISVSPATLDFGTLEAVTEGNPPNSSTKYSTITNDGNADLTLYNSGSSYPHSWDGTSESTLGVELKDSSGNPATGDLVVSPGGTAKIYQSVSGTIIPPDQDLGGPGYWTTITDTSNWELHIPSSDPGVSGDKIIPCSGTFEIPFWNPGM